MIEGMRRNLVFSANKNSNINSYINTKIKEFGGNM